MDLSALSNYGVRDGVAELVFEEGTRLLFVPHRHGGEVRGLDSILFYRNGTLEALATVLPQVGFSPSGAAVDASRSG